MITGIDCKNREICIALINEIKMFEQERLECNAQNIHQFSDLYALLYKVQNKL